MGRWLYRLGRWCAHNRAAVIAIWAVMLAGTVSGVALSGAKTNDDFTLPGTQSQKALDVLERSFPALSGASAQLVFVAPEGATITSAQAREEISRVLGAAERSPEVAGVTSPFSTGTVSRNDRVAVATVLYPLERSLLKAGTTTALEAKVAAASSGGDLKVVVGGNVFGITGVAVGADELSGVVVALVVLLVAFGSVLAAGMTVFSALLGVAVGLAGLLSLSKVVTISSSAPTLALMIGLAVGMDYTLFIVSRHRAQLALGATVSGSIGRAIATSGTAVTFAGSTVIIAMAGLSVVDIPFLTVMGLAASLTVLVAVLIALTLLPAMLSLSGERLRPKPGTRAARSAAAALEIADGSAPRSFGANYARSIVTKPLPTLAIAVLALLALAVPAHDLSLAMPDNSNASPGSGPRVAYELISKNFGPGFNGPLLLLVEPKATASKQNLLRSSAIVRADVLALPDVVAAGAPELSPGDHVAVVEVFPGTGPSGSATKDLVSSVRRDEPALQTSAGSTVEVTGPTAVDIDISNRLGSALAPFAALVVGLALVILLLLFRSVVVPLKAALGFLLSVGAALGIVTAIFQWGWLAGIFGVQAVGPVISFLPIVVLAVLFGLAMDYEVFMVSRIREDYMVGSSDPRGAVLTGFHHASRVVVAAALVMFAVFASFVSADDSIVKPIALAAAAGVLADAFVVRMTIIPAALAFLGHSAWWLPKWLDRLLPQVDVEGRSLTVVGTSPGASHTNLAVITTSAPDNEPPLAGPSPAPLPALRGPGAMGDQ